MAHGLAAVRHYREHLAATTPGIESEDKQPIACDDMERLNRIIPNFERQLNEETQQQKTTLAR